MSVITMRTATITEKGQISIPSEIRKLKGFRNGEKVAIIAYKDKVELRPFSKTIKGLEMAMLSEKSLAKDWDSKEDEEAWKDL